MRRTLNYGAIVLAVMLAGVFAACGGDDDDGDAPGGGDGATSVATGSADTPRAGGGDGQTLEIAAENSESFTKDELSAEAGEITVVFDNRETGITHNINFFEGDSASGESIGKTELAEGPSVRETTFTVAAGEHFFHCDVHPQMQGTLTVE